MTIQELIDELNEIEDKSKLILISKDEEGNDFKKFSCFSEVFARPEGRRSYEVKEENELIYDLEDEEYSNEEIDEIIQKEYIKCLCFWP